MKRVVNAYYAAYKEQQDKKKVFLALTTEIDMVLPNKITVYQLSKKAFSQLSKYIEEY